MTAYTDYVKKYAAEHKMTYKEAMKAASASYKESVGKGVEVPKVEPAKVEEPKVEEPKVEEPKYIMAGCVANGFPVWEDNVLITKPKRVRASKAKGIVTKMLDEDAGGAQHIYPLDVVKVLKMDIK